MMSKELQALMDRVDLKRFAKRPPKKMLYRVLKEIERKRHYGTYRNWEWLVEYLAKWLVLNEDISLSQMGPVKSFEGLSLEEDKLYNELSPLLKRYVVAAKNNPWDHLGEVYIELGLVGLGQNMTPKGVVDMMIKMTYPEKVTKISTQLDILCAFTYPKHSKIMPRKARTLCWYRQVPIRSKFTDAESPSNLVWNRNRPIALQSMPSEYGVVFQSSV